MAISLPQTIKENLRFLCVEVDSQLASLEKFFENPTLANARRISDRAGYAYNLRTRIQTSCVNKLAKSKQRGAERLTLRGVEFVATDLERLTELSRDCVKQMADMDDTDSLQPKAYRSMFTAVRKGVSLVEPALIENDSKRALEIGELEEQIANQYNDLLQKYMKALGSGKHTKDLTLSLFVAQSVRQMASVLLHISESIISASLGQPVNFERYFSLQSLVSDLETEDSLLKIEPIAETRSGSAISGITHPESKDDEYVAIFKDGVKQKVKEERQGVRSWHEIYPGLAPKILSYKKSGQSAALLIEHLPGLTFEDVLVNESDQRLADALKALHKTLKSVWKETRKDQQVPAQHIAQMKKRLPDVYKIHPEFEQGQSNIGGHQFASLSELLDRAEAIEEQLTAPFSVYIHGDFNVDNIIYDPEENRINFIDLHRSKYMDYVQDVSVFMVSNYRLQILDAPVRKRILKIAMDFYREVKRFANKVDDHTFDARLALGLARSFATSTRFILDKAHAKSMFYRSRYLLERLIETPADKYHRFKVPVKEIFVD
ncbi:MAG: aminoglycoside phosphotransferase family protein [Pseudomonadales bacterium]|nr:aminoglycoside phosphotransferase family protein [Pseudomonadales bacterium]